MGVPKREKPIDGSEIPDILRSLGQIFGPGVSLTIAAQPPGQNLGGEIRPDMLIQLGWGGKEFGFVAEAKTRNSPRVLEDALRQARRAATTTGLLPMVIVPFLGEGRLERLIQEGVSGLDLCGNGVVIVPGQLLLRRTGNPNRYREVRPARFAYRGATALVPRAFLRRSVYRSLGEIKEEIEAGGGSIAISTVSKALQRMEEDLVVDRAADQISLLQPDKLLDLLAESFLLPKRGREMSAKTGGSLADLFWAVNADDQTRMVLSGASSQDRYAAGIRADRTTIYCKNLDEVRQRSGGNPQPTERFADVLIIETREPTPYFDARRDQSGMTYASPVQVYLELTASGEKRDREIALQARDFILSHLER